MTPRSGEAEVIVAGAGPVGLVTALLLAAQSVAVTVVDAGPPEVAPQWRGSTVHPPTLELLEDLDLAAPMVAGGVRVGEIQYRDLELPERASFDMSLLEGSTPYPFRLQFEQYKLLRMLRERAPRRGVDLRFCARVVGVAAGGDGVEVTVDTGGAVSTLRAGWLVGADGSHSSVRKALGIPFEGAAAPDESVVVATPLDFAGCVAGLGPVSYWSGPEGRLSLIRTPDVWRVALTADAALLAEARAARPSRRRGEPSAAVDRRLAGVTGGAPVPLEQFQAYRNHYRVAASFRAGRVVLAGDAAHLTATTGGMGLNSGIHDAFELAARLGPVVRGRSAEGELDAYAAVRRKVASEVTVPATRRAGTAVDQRWLEQRRRRLRDLGATAADPDRARAFLRSASMLEAVGAHPVLRRAPAGGHRG